MEEVASKSSYEGCVGVKKTLQEKFCDTCGEKQGTQAPGYVIRPSPPQVPVAGGPLKDLS